MPPSKKDLFLNLSKVQKSSLLSYLKSFVSKKKSQDESFLYEEFLEEQQYYINIAKPYFCFIEEAMEDETFLRDLKFFIKDLCFRAKQKELQKPYIEKQKQLAKEQRKKAQEFKMSKEPPTPKQLSYYKSLCKKHNIEKQPLDGLSKLDLKNLIAKLTENDMP